MSSYEFHITRHQEDLVQEGRDLLTYYTSFTKKLAMYDKQNPFDYLDKALPEEVGEYLGRVAKYKRKHWNSDPNEIHQAAQQLRDDVEKELGDIMFMLVSIIREWGFTPEEIIRSNISKLEDRLERNVVIGEGDNR